MREEHQSVKILFRYLKFLKNSRAEVFFAIVSGIVYGLSSGFGIPVILKYSSSILFGNNEVGTPVLWGLSLLPVLVMAVRGISGFFCSYFFAACGQHIVEELRMLIFKKMQRLHLGFFHDCPPAELISRSINASTIIQNSLIDIAKDIITQPMTLIGSVGFLVYLCVQQSDVAVLMLFVLILPLIIFPLRNIGKRLRKKSGTMQGKTAAIIDKLNHNLSAIKEIRAFNLEENEVQRYRIACHNFSSAFLKVVKYQLIISPLVEVVSAIGIGFAMVFSYKSGLKLEVFIALVTALYFCYDPIKRLGALNGNVQTALAAVDRIEAILSEPEKIANPLHPVLPRKMEGKITFDDVNFSYIKGKPVLKNINIDMAKGRTYALVGASGAGKSTFVNMVLRFFDVDSGRIMIDDIDIRDMGLKNLRENISYVPQDPALIQDTVRNNILWGKPDATEEEVIEAAKKAHAHEFIVQMPLGYDTVIGESGALISGGQRQRIALARIFLRDCPIIIFDEATSALDAESQKAIYKAVKQLYHNKTVIIISHRFSMMSIVDEVLVFDKGRIEERGTPKSLMNGDTIYKRLYDNQQTAKV